MTQPAHPLEAVFDLEPGGFKFNDTGTTSDERSLERASTLVDPTNGEIIDRTSAPQLDELEKEERIEDLHIDAHLEGVRVAAVDAFERQNRMSQEVDPKFSARNAEVAAQYLNIALNAINSRVDAKFKRQKVRIAKQEAGAPTTVNNNVIVADRNVMLQELLKKALATEEKK